MTATSSTSIRASWTSLPEYARHGDITGYKLFYRQKGSVDNLVMESVSGVATLTKDFDNLNKYTKYEFQVLAVGSHGEGPKSSVKVEQTLEDGKRLKLNSVGCKKHFSEKTHSFEHTVHVHLARFIVLIFICMILSKLSYYNY